MLLLIINKKQNERKIPTKRCSSENYVYSFKNVLIVLLFF